MHADCGQNELLPGLSQAAHQSTRFVMTLENIAIPPPSLPSHASFLREVLSLLFPMRIEAIVNLKFWPFSQELKIALLQLGRVFRVKIFRS